MSETQELDYYLQNTMPAEDRLVMEANLLLNKELREKAYWQNQVYALIRQHSRKKLKAEIESVHQKLFTERKFETFRQKISSIFKRNL